MKCKVNILLHIDAPPLREFPGSRNTKRWHVRALRSRGVQMDTIILMPRRIYKMLCTFGTVRWWWCMKSCTFFCTLTQLRLCRCSHEWLWVPCQDPRRSHDQNMLMLYSFYFNFKNWVTTDHLKIQDKTKKIDVLKTQWPYSKIFLDYLWTEGRIELYMLWNWYHSFLSFIK